MELKFRHFDLYSKRMMYSDKDFFSLEEYFSGQAYQESDDMQFTGLKDKNGVEIYAGDIVNGWNNNPNGIHIVEYVSDKYNCGFMAREVNGLGKIHVWYDGLKVIGNIYENHELLEQSK